MKYIVQKAVKNKVNEAELMASKSFLIALDCEVEQLILKVVNTAKMDHRKIISGEHFALMKRMNAVR